MQVVINISKKLYDRYKEKDHIKRCDIDEFEKALDSCIILPKGHGDLIDRNQIEYIKAIHNLKWGKITASECAAKIKYSAPTIIKADRADKEEI